MKIKTSELIGATLDWAVAKADNNLYPIGDVRLLDGRLVIIEPGDYERTDVWRSHNPTQNWAQGGPIIEREEICTKRQSPCSVGYEWNAYIWTKQRAKGGSSAGGSGPTPLIAAMRCYCCAKLGDIIDVPEELCL